MLAMALALPAPSAADDAPSFSRSRATSHANRLICATPALAAMDRKLARDFAATLRQGGIDARAFEAEEHRWLRTVKERCADRACLEAAYSARDRAVLDESLRAASPAAYGETRPFPAPEAQLAAASAWIGKPCGQGPSAALPGASRIKGYLPIVISGGYVAPLEIGGARFAFLMIGADGGSSDCEVADVVTLPDAGAGMSFLQCTLGDAGDHGFGVRAAGRPAATAYWSIDVQARRLIREPLGVLSGSRLACRTPETGE